jgi:phage terminase small subunit
MFDRAKTPRALPSRSERGPRRRTSSRPQSVDTRRERFVAEYLVDFNATQAAIRSGYARNSAHVQGARLLSDANVAAAIASKHASMLRDLEVTAERVIAELAAIGLSNMADFVRIDANGQAQIDVGELDRCQAAAIQEISVTTETFVAKSGATRTVRRETIKLADKTAALVALARHLGLFDGAGAGLAQPPHPFAGR